MKLENLSISLEVYQNESELSDDDQQLLARAAEQLKYAYAPYSRFRVGAALLLANGEIITGNNVENAAYPMCLCAEQTAMGAAASRFPDVPIVSLAVTVRNEAKLIDTPAGPCGACRQIISEAEDRHRQKISIIMRGESGPVFKLQSAKDLLPVSFSGTFLP
ncbi:cytidine deaminase [Flavilitoribacter nigricans]|uniref:Cytidine deaminase n=1 Tax=Flavilitoribacter nigricans (strain ATCC 23147 / DSM 23189 / NBRC 102662 / NCIMB 1420 / SS-2) TaxID=1122177 RepID=A0A2D0N048_FLAN2|nr:cytidine deaminase [Flavilitoribacter nigricans]PHN01758.1 cytidine deaminase [Flavilitoribacter nigricans DSM 23189 = NBRC 102662]